MKMYMGKEKEEEEKKKKVKKKLIFLKQKLEKKNKKLTWRIFSIYINSLRKGFTSMLEEIGSHEKNKKYA